MTEKKLTLIVASVTILANLIFAFTGITAKVTCSVQTAMEQVSAAVLLAFEGEK